MDTSKSFPSGGIRVSDADRDQAIAELSEHFQAGRLTQEEFEERSGRALQARTGDDLAALFTDLPGRDTVPVPAAGGPVFGAGGAGDLNRMSHLPMARLDHPRRPRGDHRRQRARRYRRPHRVRLADSCRGPRVRVRPAGPPLTRRG